jgi:hypothetical protein
MSHMEQPKNIVVNVGLLYDAITAAGGMKRAAAKWRVDTNRINMLLLHNKVPRLDCLKRICDGAKIKPSELIHMGPVARKSQNMPGKVVPMTVRDAS